MGGDGLEEREAETEGGGNGESAMARSEAPNERIPQSIPTLHGPHHTAWKSTKRVSPVAVAELLSSFQVLTEVTSMGEADMASNSITLRVPEGDSCFGWVLKVSLVVWSRYLMIGVRGKALSVSSRG